MKIGSQCFFALVLLLVWVVSWCVLLLFSPQKWTADPSSTLQNCSMPHCTLNSSSSSIDLDAVVSIKPWLHVQACGAISSPPAECLGVDTPAGAKPSSSVRGEMHPEVPVWSLWAAWESLWDKHRKGYFQSDSPVCSGEPHSIQRVSLGVSVTSFHQNVYFLSIIGISFKSIANTLILSFNQILAMLSIYKLTLTHPNPFSANRTPIVSFSLNLLLFLPFMSKPGTAAQLTALLNMQVYKVISMTPLTRRK